MQKKKKKRHTNNPSTGMKVPYLKKYRKWNKDKAK